MASCLYGLQHQKTACLDQIGLRKSRKQPATTKKLCVPLPHPAELRGPAEGCMKHDFFSNSELQKKRWPEIKSDRLLAAAILLPVLFVYAVSGPNIFQNNDPPANPEDIDSRLRELEVVRKNFNRYSIASIVAPLIPSWYFLSKQKPYHTLFSIFISFIIMYLIGRYFRIYTIPSCPYCGQKNCIRVPGPGSEQPFLGKSCIGCDRRLIK